MKSNLLVGSRGTDSHRLDADSERERRRRQGAPRRAQDGGCHSLSKRKSHQRGAPLSDWLVHCRGALMRKALTPHGSVL